MLRSRARRVGGASGRITREHLGNYSPREPLASVSPPAWGPWALGQPPIGLVPMAPKGMPPRNWVGSHGTKKARLGVAPMAPPNLGVLLVSFTGKFADNLE